MNIAIIGAGSAIAKASARKWAAKGARLVLLGRDLEAMNSLSSDLIVRGAQSVDTLRFSANEFEQHGNLIDRVFDKLQTVDVILICHGSLPDQAACQDDADEALREIGTNGLSVISLVTPVANRMEKQGSGTIAVISSVAGDRGRQSNYVYGAAKALVSTYLQGLRNRLSYAGVDVLDIKPGFVDTPMTAAFDKGPLWAQPDAVAKDIFAGIEKGRSTIYTPRFWWIIMFIIRAIPEFIFKRMKL